MDKLILCEFPWQVDLIKEELSGDETVIAFDAATGYALEREEIPYSDVRRYYDHDDLWRRYPEFAERILRIADRLDKIIWEADTRFAEEQLRVSDLFVYQLKIAVDQISYKVLVVRQILKTHCPVKRLMCLEVTPPAVDDTFVFLDNFSIVSHIANVLKHEFDYEIEFVNFPESSGLAPISFPVTFRQAVRKLILFNRASMKRWITSLFRRSQINILSVDCWEIDTLEDAFRDNEITVQRETGAGYVSRNCVYRYTDDVLEAVRVDSYIREALVVDGVDGFDIVLPGIRRFLESLEHFQKVYQDTKRGFQPDQIQAVFVQTLASYSPSNIFYSHLCRTLGIPLVCWMHGGYGAYYSLPGFDLTDYRLGKYHIIYGQSVNNLLKSERCVLNRLGFEGHRVYVGGSPWMEQRFRHYVRPANHRKIVLLSIGNPWGFNRFYFGYNRPYAEFRSWEEHRAIIEIFVKYQDRYDFIIKDYPNPVANMRDTWASLLNDLGGTKVKLITDEEPYSEVLSRSDLCVLSWVSTTFIESLFSDADIFLLDNSDTTDEARTLFEQCLGYSDDIDKFSVMLEAYLDTGRFYSQDKGPVRDFFIDYSNGNRRGEVVGEIVKDIVKTQVNFR